MLLFGIIPIQCLEVSTTGFQLFNNLAESGKISKTDVTLLSEIAEVTEQTSAKDRIAEYKKIIQCRKTKTKVTPYRKALYKTTVNIGPNDLLNVTNFYPLAARNFDDIWDVVFYLEKEKHLDDTQDKCKTFADLLNETARNILLDAAKSLPYQHLDIQFKQTHQPVTAPFPEPKRRPNAEDMLTSRDHEGTETFVLSKPIAGQKKKHILEKHTTCLWISLIVVAVLVAIVIQQSVIEPTTEPVIEPTTEPVGETTTTLTAPSKDGNKEEAPREMKGNNRHERSTAPARERTISSSILNDFNHKNINYAGWEDHGSENWEIHNKIINSGYNLGERYSGSDNYYIYVAKNGRESRKKGYLNSPEIPDEWDDVCLKFDYYISNRDSQIDVDHIFNGEHKKGFKSPKHRHEQWNSATVTINTVNKQNSYFMFCGKASGSGKQIVVIDDISFSEGEC
ncbi:uncharacterized protein [Antedon mediterranea]|uniref:uncharacterized protein n=1 Tax=Antedon mediterranea TaxID=105859 RepID=UPI003AF4EE16